MKQIIVAFSGRKNAGKNTAATFIQSYYVVKYHTRSLGDIHGKKRLIQENCFECSFADNLKEFCINTLGLSYEQCYGSDEEKNTPTKYKWEDVPEFLRWKFGDEHAKKLVAEGQTQDELMASFIEALLGVKEGPKIETLDYDTDFLTSPYLISEPASVTYKDGFITGREVMQLVGTDLIRQVFGNVWAEATVRTIKKHGKPLNLITDNRFPNEIEAVLNEPDGYIIRLTRSPFGTEDVHPSESALDNYDWSQNDHCYVLDNREMNIEEQNQATIPVIQEIFERSGLTL